MVVPHRLGVVMCMDIDEAGRNELALRGNLLRARAGDGADLGYLAVLDGDIGLERRAPGAVNDSAAANNQIMSDIGPS